MARHTATAVQAVSWLRASSGTLGRRRTEQKSPFPFRDWKALPRRPRPAVCSSERTARPSAAPSAARRLTSLLVESTVSRQTTSRPTRWPERAAVSSPVRRSSGAAESR